MKTLVRLAVVFLLLSIFTTRLSTASAQGTAFTYQGRLNDGANPASGTYDLRFAVYDALTSGAQQGVLVTNTTTAVSNGLFTVTLDFGNQFPGANRWLEIAVRTNGVGTFSVLTPRQQINSTPYAVQAVNAAAADNATTATTAGNFSGPLAGDVTGPQGATVVASVGGQSAANVAGGASAANAATSANTANTIVKRDASGNFSGGTISGNFFGNAGGLTNINLLAAVPAGAVTVNLLTTPGTFGFTNASTPVVDNDPHSLVAADVNGDGKLDLITADYTSKRLTVMTNNGSGVFVQAVSMHFGIAPMSVAAAYRQRVNEPPRRESHRPAQCHRVPAPDDPALTPD